MEENLTKWKYIIYILIYTINIRSWVFVEEPVAENHQP